jgi:hypothetical protein
MLVSVGWVFMRGSISLAAFARNNIARQAGGKGGLPRFACSGRSRTDIITGT